MRSERTPMIAGNWKMYTTSGEGAILIDRVQDLVSDVADRVDVVVCPPFTGLKAASTIIEVDATVSRQPLFPHRHNGPVSEIAA